MESKWVPGAIWGPQIPKKKKSAKKRLDLLWIWPPFGVHFSTWEHFFRCQFLMFFGKYIFRTLGDFWKPKVPKRLPKWSQNGAQRKPGGTPWEVRKPWYLLYGRHMRETRGGSGRQLFPDCVSRSSLESSPGVFAQIFMFFGARGEASRLHLKLQVALEFQAWKRGPCRMLNWRGRRQGRSLSKLKNLKNLATDPTRPAPPEGGAAN